MAIGQSDGGIFLDEVPSSYMILDSVKLTETQQALSIWSIPGENFDTGYQN